MNFEKPRKLRQSMAWAHTWAGLTLGWLLFAIFVMGSLSFYRTEITLWMQPELHRAQPNAQAIDTALAALQKAAPTAQQWTIVPPGDRYALVNLSWIEPQPARTQAGRDRREANGENPGGRGERTQPQNQQGRGGGGRNQEGFKRAVMDPATGELLTPRQTAGGNFLYRFHFELYGMDRLWARWIVGIATMFMLMAIVSGVIVHRNIFRDFFTFRTGKGQRSWLDGHDASAVLGLPFHFVITFSGLILLSAQLMPSATDAAYGDNPRGFTQEMRAGGGGRGGAPTGKAAGQPAELTDLNPLLQQAIAFWPEGISAITINHPGDANATIELRQARAEGLANRGATQTLLFNGVTGEVIKAPASFTVSPTIAVWNMMSAVHMGRFASPLPRLLLFLSGILGSLMVASGLIMWLVARAKEREKFVQKNARTPFGHRLVEVLNVAAIAGIFIATAAYFLGNRLLPAELAGRPQQEIAVFFAAWATTLAHALMRPHKSAWVEQLSIAGVLLMTLPLVNAVTGGAHLGISLTHAQWQVAGFDIASLVIGAGLLLSAHKVKHHQPRAAKKRATSATANPDANQRGTDTSALVSEEAR